MMFEVRTETGKVTRLLFRVRKAAFKRPGRVESYFYYEIAKHIAIINRLTWREKKYEWRRVSMPTMIFSRKTSPGARVGTMRLIKMTARGLTPLYDTGRLYCSLMYPHFPDFGLFLENHRIIYRSKVPYARKHLRGDVTQPFTFGSIERHKLKERVPPPGALLAETGRKPFGAKKGMRDRPYYRLLKWAERRYPAVARIPKRSWVRIISKRDASQIGGVIARRIVKFAKTGEMHLGPRL